MKFVWQNDTDWFVAHSLEECKQLAIEYNKRAGLDPDEIDLDFTLCYPPTRLMTILIDNEKVTKTLAEWAEETHVGLLCSTEY